MANIVDTNMREKLRLGVSLPRVLVGLALLACVTLEAGAQRATVAGAIQSVDNTPVQFALVRLVGVDSAALPSPIVQALTTGAGRYRLDDVPTGRYRLVVLRIGLRPEFSEVVEIKANVPTELSFRVQRRTVVLPPVVVTGERCVSARDLDTLPRTRTLWQQARDGAVIRTEVMAQYRYQIDTREEAVERKADGSPVGAVDHHRVNEPRFAVQNASRYRRERLSRGYYGATLKDGTVSFFTPSELDVLHEEFLHEHCLVPVALTGDGEIGLRFRPSRTRKDLLDIAGTIWLDATTFLARRIELEYVDGDDARGTVRMDFADVLVDGGLLRMPVGGAIDLRSSRTDPTRHARSTYTIRYSAFESVRPSSR